MIRLFASIIVSLFANAIGLLAASVMLDNFSINGLAFITAVIIFTLAYQILDPLITKISFNNIPALRGGVALVTTFVGLVVTSLISDGIEISGASTWILATLIVWLFGLISAVLLPMFVFKKVLQNNK
jgi:putative membrane protein